jgi:hypothetical protein
MLTGRSIVTALQPKHSPSELVSVKLLPGGPLTIHKEGSRPLGMVGVAQFYIWTQLEYAIVQNSTGYSRPDTNTAVVSAGTLTVPVWELNDDWPTIGSVESF